MHMERAALEERKASVEQRFTALVEANRLNNEELFRLAGETRLLDELLAGFVDPTTKKEKK